MALATLLSTSLPAFVAIGGLTALVIAWLIRLPRFAIGFLFLSLAAGQIIRLPLPGQGGGLLLSDLAAVIIIICILPRLLSSYTRFSVVRRILLITTPFIFWSLFTLTIKFSGLGLSNTLVAVSYWLRLTVILMLLPALTFLFYNSSLRKYAWRCLYLTIILLILFGIMQLMFIPSLSPYTSAGWDPHQLRLVSTWIDPNFFGAFLVISLAVIVLGPDLRIRQRVFLVLMTACALFATQSRSAFIALILALLFMTPLFLVFFSNRLSVKKLQFVVSLVSLFALIFILITTLLLPRFVGLVSIDPTVRARITNIQGALSIVEDHSLLGVGYNAYQFAAREAGVISGFQIHSRAGTDNSFLTIWATTGVIGLFLFLIIWIFVAHQLFINLRRRRDPVSFLGLFSLLVLIVHSQFVNSLIYSHLLITLIIIISLALAAAGNEQERRVAEV